MVAPDPLHHVNPALEPLQILVGQWEAELSTASFLERPTDTVLGQVSFDWVLNGSFLLLRMGDKPPSPPSALWLIGRDESTRDYTVLYYDARTVSRVYHMTFSDGVWKMNREAPGFWQRFEAVFSSNGNTINGRWDKSTDGVRWEHDFDVKYSRRTDAA